MRSILYVDNEQKEVVGLPYVLDKLSVSSPYAIDLVKNIKVFKRSQEKELISEFDNIELLVDKINTDIEAISSLQRSFMRLKDITNSLRRCKNDAILDEVELYEIKMFIMETNEIVSKYQNLNLTINGIQFVRFEGLAKLFDPENTKLPTFYIYDAYSENLKQLRLEKKEIEQKIYKSDDKEEIKLLKEQRLDIVILEEKEELVIKTNLTSEIKKVYNDFYTNINSIGKLEFLIAKAELAIKFSAIRPVISSDMDIELKNCINPKIEDVLKSKGKVFSPVSISLKSGVTVITGANMGGKSVSLKTIVLNLYLAQLGFYVFAKEATIPMLDFIFHVSDDMQSVSKGLSTFGAEIVKLKGVIQSVKNKNGFVALDEFARGTNPKEGTILVKALCQYLNEFDSITLVSTHYDGVVDDKMTHYQVRGLKDVNFEALSYKIDLNKKNSVEIIQESMDYGLELVTKDDVVPKDALSVAMLLGLEPDVVKIAKQLY